jgi:sugar-specific transcriptional regulator TrmB
MADLIKKLEAFGFTNYESKVFMVLMKGHNMTAAEIAEEAKIPRTSVYDILKSFAEKGICNEIQTPSKLRYEMIDPDVVEDKLEKELDNNYKKKLSELKSSFAELKPLFKAGDPTEHMQDVELLRGFNKHRRLKLLELIQSTKKELLLINRLEGKVISKDEEQNEESSRLLKSGGVIKTIYQMGSFKLKENDKWVDVDNKRFLEFCINAEKEGAQVRIAKKVPPFVVVFDRACVFFALNVESVNKHNRTDVIVKNDEFSEAMVHLFNSYWSDAMTVSEFKKTLK